MFEKAWDCENSIVSSCYEKASLRRELVITGLNALLIP